MKPRFVFILFFALFTGKGYGQEESIHGNWILSTVETPGRQIHPYLLNSFDSSGAVFVYGQEVAGWSQRDQSVYLKSDRVKIYNGHFRILRHTSGQLILGGDSVTIYYDRAYDRKQNNPVYQQLLGTWMIYGTNGSFVRFEEDGRFVMVKITPGGTVTTKGTWLFIPGIRSFVVLADVDVLRKKNTILTINKDYMEVVTDSIHYQLDKRPEVSQLEHLNFDEDDLTGNDDSQPDLPWNDDLLWSFLPKIKYVNYVRSVYYPGVKTFLDEDISVDISVDAAKQSITFSTYKDLGEERIPLFTVSKGPVHNAYNRFFPQKTLDYYRVIDRKRPWKYEGKTYECTVVNGMTGDRKYQYWMINSMPGIYARIIYETQEWDNNPVYIKYELNYIEKN